MTYLIFIRLLRAKPQPEACPGGNNVGNGLANDAGHHRNGERKARVFECRERLTAFRCGCTRPLYLNNQNQLIAGETLFTGTINRTEVHPREVIKRALYHNAAAVVLAHNHPSGEVTPSKADRLITERLVQALALVDIRVPDHLIVGGSQVFSFAEHGLL